VRAESAGDAEVEALRREVNRLQSELDAERAAAASTAAQDAAPASRSARSVWGWFVAAALLALGAGFLLGWRVLDRRIRRQYGGLRIY
jgi:type VI protein secretion system component VasF